MQGPPFANLSQLNNDLNSLDTSDVLQLRQLHLPGQPYIHMDQAARIQDFLNEEFLLKDIEKLSSHLWMMSKHDSKSISPLHRQKVKGREIVITEDPRLHLVWYYNRIFIKPLPKYLLSYHFWEIYLSVNPNSSVEQKALRKAVLGYLRSYFYLIRYESDFRIATDEKLQLVPSGVTFPMFCEFIASLEHISDADVSGRYSYGEIRLTRLNFYSKIFLGKFSFHRVHTQYSDYFASFYGPLLFAFALVSLVLSAMQVGLAIDSVDTIRRWAKYREVCHWFNVICLVMITVLMLWIALLFLYKFVKEWVHALADHWQRRSIISSD